MKKAKIIFMLMMLLCMSALCDNVKAVTDELEDISISTYAYVGENLPNLRGITLKSTIYAYRYPEYGKGVTNDSSLPQPFNVYHSNDKSTGTQTFFVGTWSDGSSYHATNLYCTGYTVPLKNGFELPNRSESESVFDWEGNSFSQETRDNIGLALIYGYITDISTSSTSADAAIIIRNGKSGITGQTVAGNWVNEHTQETFGTQVAVWLIATNQIGGQYEDAIAQHFFKIDGVLESGGYEYCKNILENVKKAKKMPSYVSKNTSDAPVYELTWNGDNNRFECVLTDSNGLNTTDKIKIEHAVSGTGFNVEMNGDQAIIWTKTAVGTKDNPVTVSVNKIINEGKGVAGFWQNYTANNGSYCQPMTALLNEPRTPETGYYKAYTKGYKIRIYKTLEKEVGNLGDATPSGSVYGIYTDKGCTNEVARVTVGDNGYSNKTDYLNYQTYYAKEISNSNSTLLNEEVYTIDPTKAATDVDGDYSVTIDAENKIKYGRVRLIKFDNNSQSSEKSPAAGAVLRLTLNSDNSQYYEATVDENGYAEFKNEEYLKKYPNAVYTIPYGAYTLTETKSSDSGKDISFFIQAEAIDIIENEQDINKVIISDTPVPAWLKLIKIDKDTGKEVKLSGAKFKIWDVANKQWVKLLVTPKGELVDEFETNDEGYCYTPEELQPGTYVVYETQAPKGYYLEDDLRIPENEEDLGNSEVSGQKVVLDKSSTGLLYDAEYPEGGIETGSLVIKVKMSDPELKVKLKIEKKAEVLTGATIKSAESPIAEYEIEEDKYTPTYTMQGLQGVTYEIYAAEDIKSPDEQVTLVKKGKKVDTITTNEEGIATTIDLYPGEYEIKETVTPAGYLKDENIPNVTLENEDQYVKSATTKKELTNVRQKLQLTFEKIFEDSNFANSKTQERKALFGVYTKNAIMDYTGKNIVIPANKLVDLIVTDENNDVTSQIDLPEGTYEVRELYVTYPYTISTKEQTFELKYNNNSEQPFVTVEGEEIINTPQKADLSVIKISESNLVDEDEVLEGGVLTQEQLDERMSDLSNWFKRTNLTEVKEYLENKESTYEEISKKLNDTDKKYYRYISNKLLTGAKYEIYLDKEFTEPLVYEDSGEKVTIETNLNGYGEVKGIPIGTYYLKEVQAPTIKVGGKVISYDVDQKPKEVKLTLENRDEMVFTAFTDTIVKATFTKEDIFTSELVPDCTFVIKDSSGKEVVKAETNDEGIFILDLDWFKEGEEYTYTELEAPDKYNIDTTPHPFTIKFDENGSIIPVPISNTRKTSTVTLTKLDFADSTVIPNCKFELRSLETDYVVTGVTDEKGIYVFKDVPYGKYTYTELEAPEEYLIDTTPHEIEINAEEIEIKITNEKAPDTGDIAVYALSALAIISAIGIIYTVRKHAVKSK